MSIEHWRRDERCLVRAIEISRLATGLHPLHVPDPIHSLHDAFCTRVADSSRGTASEKTADMSHASC